MADIFYTISKEGKGLVREKMSRFLSFAIHVDNVEQTKVIIKEYQNKFHDARHVCWAYMLGPKRDLWQLSDNGEPSGTAGKPILGQINSRGLTDVLVIVVRYFGGIKLGTSGLIQAYKDAASEALDDAEIIECFDMDDIRITFDYMVMDGIMRILKSEKLDIVEKNFDNLCSILIKVRKDHSERIKKALQEAGGRIESE